MHAQSAERQKLVILRCQLCFLINIVTNYIKTGFEVHQFSYTVSSLQNIVALRVAVSSEKITRIHLHTQTNMQTFIFIIINRQISNYICLFIHHTLFRCIYDAVLSQLLLFFWSEKRIRKWSLFLLMKQHFQSYTKKWHKKFTNSPILSTRAVEK